LRNPSSDANEQAPAAKALLASLIKKAEGSTHSVLLLLQS
jgi:hypothetical protein